MLKHFLGQHPFQSISGLNNWRPYIVSNWHVPFHRCLSSFRWARARHPFESLHLPAAAWLPSSLSQKLVQPPTPGAPQDKPGATRTSARRLFFSFQRVSHRFAQPPGCPLSSATPLPSEVSRCPPRGSTKRCCAAQLRGFVPRGFQRSARFFWGVTPGVGARWKGSALCGSLGNRIDLPTNFQLKKPS